MISAHGVRADGVREILGIDAGLREDAELWREFLQGLLAPGTRVRVLRGVKLVTSDGHRGLQQASSEVFVGAAWQRCRVQFLRNIEARVPKTAQQLVLAAVRPIFHQADRASAQGQLAQVCTSL